MKIDLHVHTSASDGKYPPAELVRRAAAAGVSVLGITDHDTVAGIEPALEAAHAFPHLRIIPGVEINTDVPAGEAHVLGYFIDYNDPELLSRLSALRDSRYDRARRMVEKLTSLGMPVSFERVQEIAATDAIGRPHVAQALLEKGYITSLKEAFDKYIGFNGPAYVERTRMTPAEAVRIVLKAKGVPVLAHPLTVPEPEAMIRDLKAEGLVGMEVYYGGYAVSDISRLLAFAAKYSLVATGGSDYHGLDEKTETGLGEAGVPARAVDDLFAAARAKRQP